MLKHIIKIASTSICTPAPAPARAQAQECSKFFFLQKDKTIEMTIYNKKGEPNGKQVYQVSDVASSGATMTGKLASEMFDKKGKSMDYTEWYAPGFGVFKSDGKYGGTAITSIK